MTEMVERVARVLFDANAGKYLFDADTLPQWDFATPIERLFYTMAAQAAITAIREPTEAMEEAGKQASLSDGAHDCEVPISVIYKSMIEAALGGAW